MDFSNILGFLQNLLTDKQGQQATEYGQNLGLQQQALGQSGQEFESQLAAQTAQQQAQNELAQQQLGLQGQQQTANIAAQQAQTALAQAAQQFSQGFSEQQLNQATDQFNKQFGMNLSAQEFAQQLAQQQQNQSAQQQTWQQGFQDRMNPTPVAPGSASWYSMLRAGGAPGTAPGGAKQIPVNLRGSSGFLPGKLTLAGASPLASFANDVQMIPGIGEGPV